MTPVILKYPLDLTGVSPNNLVVGEPHAISNRAVRAVATNYGPFYTAGLIVYDANNPGVPLIAGDADLGGQYVPAELYEEATVRTGKEVCAVIVITDATVSENIILQYQVVGGEFSTCVDAINSLIANLDLDDRPVDWGEILGKPDAFTPTHHLHDIGDVYGFEYVVDALERVRGAILMGDVASHDEIYRYIDHYVGLITDAGTATAQALANHEADHTNPHVVTQTQVGLGLVSNFATAQLADALAGTANNLFMTPLMVANSINNIAGNALNAHLADLGNPHQVTKAQVGLSNVDNFATASQAEAIAGTSAMRFMTPLGVQQAVFSQAVTPLNTHLADHGNPHNVTQGQVGLSNVSNFATATIAAAQAGLSSSLFVTPAGVAAYSASQIMPTVNSHINNTNNPHGTTAAQVGAYTIAQTNSLVSGYLPVNGTAANSNALGGSNLASVLAQAYAQVGTMGKRNIFVSTAAPSAGTGAVGDIWFQYT